MLPWYQALAVPLFSLLNACVTFVWCAHCGAQKLDEVCTRVVHLAMGVRKCCG